MIQISEIRLSDRGYAEIQADTTGHLTEPVSVRFHSPATHHQYLTPAEAYQMASDLIIAAAKAEGRTLAGGDGHPLAVIDALSQHIYHPGSDPAAEVRAALRDQAAGLASCGHPRDEDGQCSCASWPERAPAIPDPRAEINFPGSAFRDSRDSLALAAHTAAALRTIQGE